MDVLKNKVALITGAGRGIGRSIAETLARAGADVALNDLPASDAANPEELEGLAALVESLGRRAAVIRADVADRTAVRAMVDQTVETFGRLDILVSNVAQNERSSVLEADWDTFRRIVEVNQFGLFHLCQAAAQKMAAQHAAGSTGSNIVIISSVHADVPLPTNAAYAMTKAAANQFCRVLASELFEHRIRVNAVNPGWIDTPGERKHLPQAELMEAGRRLPWGRLGRADEIAKAVRFLCSDDASYITGAILDVDGGFKAGLQIPGAKS